MNRKYFIYATIVYCVLLLLASTLPGVSLPKVNILGIDKLFHFIAYTILGFLAVNSFRNVNTSILLLIIIAGSIYGGFNEIWQMYVADRYASIYDEIANGIGMIIGSIVTYKYLIFSHD